MIWSPGQLTTVRLTLRPHRASDLNDLLAFHSDAEVVRYIPWPERTREQVSAALLIKGGQGTARAAGDVLVLAIEFEGAVIGEVLLKRISDDQAELGYVLGRSFWGRGLASEAAALMVDTGFEAFGLRRIAATLDARNAASAALLERLGFRLSRSVEAEFKGEMITELEYAIERLK
jgi:RimJ/RimL family protein N-acetyltransferase